MRELSLHILDVLENTLAAGATCVDLVIKEDLVTDQLTVAVHDNGRGMNEEQLNNIYDPFFTTRTTRHVGLGIPLFKAAAERCIGELTVTSQPGQGTTLRATFQHSHIDRAPLGDIEGTLLAFILSGSCDLHYVHRIGEETFEFHTADIRAELGDIPLTHSAVRNWLQEFIIEGETELRRQSL
ncbi:MAG: ATP-binding protein [Chloroflexi bacterium]|nr:ATP-binding protein [Chloroflexota bacterium]